MEFSEILKRPYHRVLVPDPDTGTFTATIQEFPGCIAQGDSADEAYRELEAAAEEWIDGLLSSGLPVPEPEEPEEFSGRVVFRMPRSLHARLSQAGKREGVSLNTFLVAAASEHVVQSSTESEVAVLRRELLEAMRTPFRFGGYAASVPTRPNELDIRKLEFAITAGTPDFSAFSADTYSSINVGRMAVPLLPGSEGRLVYEE